MRILKLIKRRKKARSLNFLLRFSVISKASHSNQFLGISSPKRLRIIKLLKIKAGFFRLELQIVHLTLHNVRLYKVNLARSSEHQLHECRLDFLVFCWINHKLATTLIELNESFCRKLYLSTIK